MALGFNQSAVFGKIALGVILILSIALLSWSVGFRRFQGLRTEASVEQVALAKSLAEGKGFQTPVIYPQTVVLLEKRAEDAGDDFTLKVGDYVPDLYQAPGYPVLLAAVFSVMGESGREFVFERPTKTETNRAPGFAADYVPMFVDITFLWIAAGLTYWLTRRMFNGTAALLAFGGVALSVAIWQDSASGVGTTLVMTLVLLAAIAWSYIETGRGDDPYHPESKLLPLCSALFGLACGVVFLTEYAAALILLPFVVYCGVHFRGVRPIVFAVLPALLVFAAVITPWLLRNAEVSGHPMGLVWQEIALKADDPTAEPYNFRTAFDGKAPEFSIRKVGNKTLTQLQENLSERIWSGGAYLFAGFFLVGMLYRFRHVDVDVLRWWIVAAVGLVLFAAPIFDAGNTIREPATYLAPLMIVFGAGFAIILIDSTQRLQWLKTVTVCGIIGFQGVPLLKNALEPTSIPFSLPPYYPLVMSYVQSSIADRFQPGYALMADTPAGLAWYGQTVVWAKPPDYSDFNEIMLRQNVGLLFLGPTILDDPYFTDLAPTIKSQGESTRRADWSSVYASLDTARLPGFFPLQIKQRIHLNMFVLINPIAIDGTQDRFSQ